MCCDTTAPGVSLAIGADLRGYDVAQLRAREATLRRLAICLCGWSRLFHTVLFQSVSGPRGGQARGYLGIDKRWHKAMCCGINASRIDGVFTVDPETEKATNVSS